MKYHTVLIVEDEPDLRGALAAVLESHGHDVLEARDGRDALQLLRGDPARFCFIVLDLFMPDMDGWTFRIEQTKDPRLAAIPVLVVSADSNAAKRSTGTGIVGAMTKPIDLDRLVVAVRQHC